MHKLPIRRVIGIALCEMLYLMAHVFIVSAQSPDAVDMASRINRERIARGLVPYAVNPQLTTAAQAHANDLSRTGKYRTSEQGHIGSDGSSVFDRVARTSYGAYSWGRRLGENWAYYADTARAFTEWMNSEPHRNNLLHPLYREIGVGVAPASEGGFLYVIDFGVQPNVLPFFINDISTETRSTDVTLTLSDELVMPSGDGANNIGHPIEVQISNSSDFAASLWQTYASHINWTLTTGAGTKTVYVKYRDSKGRTATASDSIFLNVPTTPLPSPTQTLTRTPRPTLIATVIASPTKLPTETPTLQPTDTPTSAPTITRTITPTFAIATPTVTPSLSGTSQVDEAITIASSASIGALGFAVVISILLAVLKESINR